MRHIWDGFKHSDVVNDERLHSIRMANSLSRKFPNSRNQKRNVLIENHATFQTTVIFRQFDEIFF